MPSMSDWAGSVQAAVTAIRGAGATSQMILLPGTPTHYLFNYLTHIIKATTTPAERNSYPEAQPQPSLPSTIPTAAPTI